MFVRYVEIICEIYKNKVKYWFIFNEVDFMICYLYIIGGLVWDCFKDKNFEEVIF